MNKKSAKTILCIAIILLVIILIILLLPNILKDKKGTLETGILDVTKQENTYQLTINNKTYDITYKYSKVENNNKPDSEIKTVTIYFGDTEISGSKMMAYYKENGEEKIAKIKPIVYKGTDKEYLVFEIENVFYLEDAGKTIIIINDEGKVLKKLSSKINITELINCPQEYVGYGNSFIVNDKSIKFLEVNKDTVTKDIKEFEEYEITIDKDLVRRKRVATYKAKTSGSLGKVW